MGMYHKKLSFFNFKYNESTSSLNCFKIICNNLYFCKVILCKFLFFLHFFFIVFVNYFKKHSKLVKLLFIAITQLKFDSISIKLQKRKYLKYLLAFKYGCSKIVDEGAKTYITNLH